MEVSDSSHYSYKRLTSLRLSNKSAHDAFCQALSKCKVALDTDWSLIMSHGSWSSLELQQHIYRVTGHMPVRIAVAQSTIKICFCLELSLSRGRRRYRCSLAVFITNLTLFTTQSIGTLPTHFQLI